MARSNIVVLRGQALPNWSATITWVDPTPGYTTYYEIEWWINSGEATLKSNVAASPYTLWVAEPWIEVGDVLYARVRAVYYGDADSLIYGEWSADQQHEYLG